MSSQRARADLKAIHDYIAKDSPINAKAVVRDILGPDARAAEPVPVSARAVAVEAAPAAPVVAAPLAPTPAAPEVAAAAAAVVVQGEAVVRRVDHQ